MFLFLFLFLFLFFFLLIFARGLPGLRKTYSASDARSGYHRYPAAAALSPGSGMQRAPSLTSIDSTSSLPTKPAGGNHERGTRHRLNSTTSQDSQPAPPAVSSSVSMPDLSLQAAVQQPAAPTKHTPPSSDGSEPALRPLPVLTEVRGRASPLGRLSPATSLDSLTDAVLQPMRKRVSSTSSLRCLLCRGEGHTLRECASGDREGLMAVLQEHNCPVPEQADQGELELVAERFNWLKALRLHKYAPLFLQQDYDWFLQQDEPSLMGLGMTAGASKKLLVKITDDPTFPWRPAAEQQPSDDDAPTPPASPPAVAAAEPPAPPSTGKRSWADELDV